MIPYRDDVLISEQIVQDLVNQFNNLTQEEKERFLKGFMYWFSSCRLFRYCYSFNIYTYCCI